MRWQSPSCTLCTATLSLGGQSTRLTRCLPCSLVLILLGFAMLGIQLLSESSWVLLEAHGERGKGDLNSTRASWNMYETSIGLCCYNAFWKAAKEC